MMRILKFIRKAIKFITITVIVLCLLYALGFRVSINFNKIQYYSLVSLLNSIPILVQLVLGGAIIYYIITAIKNCICFSRKNTWHQKVKDWIKPRIYSCGHFAIIIILSIYVCSHWEKCIDMNFFDDFDGNNILFLCWLALIFLTTYDVESKVLKIHMRKTEEQIHDVDEATLNYDLALRAHDLQNNLSEESEGGRADESDEQRN